MDEKDGSCSVTLFQIGRFYEAPTTIRVFQSREIAEKNIPKGFKIKSKGRTHSYYENAKSDEYLIIDIFQVES